MPSCTFPLDPLLGSPIGDVGFAAALAEQAEGAPPSPISWFSAIIDTGCSETSIHESVAVAAALRFLGKTWVNTSSQQIEVSTYFGDMFLKCDFFGNPMEFRFISRRFSQILHEPAGHKVLLGMDVFSAGMLNVNGHTKSATFSF